jgi:hypothetical protein
LKRLLLFLLPGGALLLLAWWALSRQSKAASSPGKDSSGYAVGDTVLTAAGRYTKESDAIPTPDGVPALVEIWTDAHGRQWTPSLSFSQGKSAPAFLPLA